MAATVVFWGAVALVSYTYVLFPLLVIVRGLIRHRPPAAQAVRGLASVIIVAHNEAAALPEKLENILALDYPRDLLEVIVASDGSTDGTAAIVRGYADRGIILIDLPRGGKARALNQAVVAAQGEYLVFTDANSMLTPGALTALLSPFADPAVGGVAGDQRYVSSSSGGVAGEGEKSYWDLDRVLKVFQSRAGSATSATGALYAVHRACFEPVPEGVTDDFFVSTCVITRGRRLVFAPQAVALEPVAASSSREFQRKVRIITRGLYGVFLRRELLNPLRYGFYAVQLFSHKVLRRLVFFPLILLALTAPLLWSEDCVYRLATLVQGFCYGLAAAGVVLSGSRFGRLKIFAFPYFFCLVNAACIVAVWNLLRGQRIVVWEPRH